MEKLEKFYRTRADFPDWMTEEEWNKKEIEILKECLNQYLTMNQEQKYIMPIHIIHGNVVPTKMEIG